MARVSAVLFDLGGTLYDYRTLEAAERESLLWLAGEVGIPAGAAELVRAHREATRRVLREYLQHSFYLHHDLFRDAIVELLRVHGVELRDGLFERYRARQRAGHERDFRLREGVLETLRALRERGLHLGIVSNIDEDQLAHLIARASLMPHFHSILSSERAGSCKPDPGIYEEALRRAGCAPAEALFVGDSRAHDIAGANRAGLRSVLLWHRDDADPPDEEPRPQHVIRRIAEVLELV